MKDVSIELFLALAIAAICGGGNGFAQQPPDKDGGKIVFAHPGIMVNDAEIKALRKAIQGGAEPQATAFKELIKAADRHLQRAPNPLKEMFIPLYYNDKQKHLAARGSLCDDSDAAYTLALAAQLTGDRKYAAKAVDYIMAWAGKCAVKGGEDTPLMASRTLVLMVYAADMLWNDKSFSKTDREKFLAWSKQTVHGSGASIERGRNNWGAWGIQAETAWAILGDDETELRRLAESWKSHLQGNMDAEGGFQHELNRHDGDKGQGISYSQFALQAYTLTAEMFLNHGIDLFAWKTSDGKTLKDAAEKIHGWEANPVSFPVKQYKQGTNNFYSCWEILYRQYKVAAWGKKLAEVRTPPWKYPFSHATEGGAWLPLTHGVTIR